MLGYVMPPQQYPICDRELAGKLDQLNQFLLHHFADEIKAYESYKAVENRLFEPTDCAVQNITDDIQMLMQSLNTLIKMIEELDYRTENIQNHENRMINIENDIGQIRHTLGAMQQQINTKQTISTRSKNTNKTDKGDK